MLAAYHLLKENILMLDVTAVVLNRLAEEDSDVFNAVIMTYAKNAFLKLIWSMDMLSIVESMGQSRLFPMLNVMDANKVFPILDTIAIHAQTLTIVNLAIREIRSFTHIHSLRLKRFDPMIMKYGSYLIWLN